MNLSVIIPVYNVKSYLRRCLDSLVAQTMRDIEIIIVDDGSTDGSAEVMDEYSSKFSNIKTIHKKNGGLMSAWIAGVRVSSGDFLGFVDSDDYILPQMYDRLYSLATKYDVDIVLSNFLINGKENKKSALCEGKYEGSELNRCIFQHLLPSSAGYSVSMSRCSKLFRRNIIIDNLKYTECLSRTFEDRYIVPAAILSAKSIYYTEEAYYCWMLREGSNHGMYKEHLLDDIKRVYNVQYQIIQDKCPSLSPLWEEAFLDFIRLYVDRNIIRVARFSTKLKSATILLNDDLTKNRLNRYGYLMKAKMGKAVVLSHKLHSPLLLAILSCFVTPKG